MERFNKNNLPGLYSVVVQKDSDLKKVLDKQGLPPIWVRPNTFATLVLTILEQQVSLASAYAAFKKLKEKLTSITPAGVLQLTAEELKACYFSRQKIIYVHELAQAILSEKVNLKKLHYLPDDVIRAQLKQLKGIGDWTVDIYLLHALKRTDIFPIGDLALVKALREVKQLPQDTSKEEMLKIAEPWKPYRSIATMILWHHYLGTRWRQGL